MADAVLTPMDAVKQKRQLARKAYTGTFDCIRRVVAQEGVRALYAGYITTLVMNIPYSFMYFATYDGCRYYMKSDPHTYDLKAHLLSGAAYVTATHESKFDPRLLTFKFTGSWF